VTSLNNTFSGCTSLTTAPTIPSSVTELWWTFSDCTSLTTAPAIPSSATYLPYTFSGCTSLTTIPPLPNSITYLGGAFSGCTSLIVAPAIPNSATSLFHTFSGCTSLTAAPVIPSSVTDLGETFEDCTSLTTVPAIPSSVTNLNSTFEDCTKLNSIQVNWLSLDKTTTNYYTFNKVPLSNAYLYVPKGAVNIYKSKSPWSSFGHIVEQTDNSGTDVNDAVLLTNDTTVYKGTQVRLPIYLKNKVNVTAFQTDLYLPSGVTVANNDKGMPMIELSDRKDDQTIGFNMQTSGAMRVLAYSATSSAFSGNSGPLFYVTLNVADTVSAGDYTIYLKNTKLSTPAAKEYSVDKMDSKLTVKDYMLGDVDGNKVITISDAVAIANHLLNTGSTTFIEKAADVDDSNEITVNDAVTLINKYILHTSGAKSNIPATRADTENDYLYISDVNINTGETIDLAIKMHNTDQITAFQTDIYLPDGISVAKNSKGKNDMTLSGRADDQTISSNIQTDGAMRVVAFSMTSAPFSENEGTLFTMKITADKDIKAGTGVIKIANTELSTPAAQAIRPEARTSSISVATGIKTISADADGKENKVYTLDGRLLKSPVKGINIIKMSDGTTKKIVVK
jgi:hypothetical protein